MTFTPAELVAYLEAAQILIAAGVALGQELKDVVVKLASLFKADPLTDAQINEIIEAARIKALAIKAQADADVAQAQDDQK